MFKRLNSKLDTVGKWIDETPRRRYTLQGILFGMIIAGVMSLIGHYIGGSLLILIDHLIRYLAGIFSPAGLVSVTLWACLGIVAFFYKR